MEGNHGDMTWTKIKPSEPGWYWTRNDGICEVVRVVHGDTPTAVLYALLPPKEAWSEGDTVALEQLHVEWWGPIEIPI